MRCIFLDIDGVLNNKNSMALSSVFGVHPNSEECGGMFTVDPTCVKLLECVILMTGAKIVISSTWRGRNVESTKNVKYAFEYAGCPELWDSVIDVTPIHADRFRGREIQEWLDNHPETTHYAIVDDDSFDVTDKEHFVHTNWEFGLQFSHAERMIHLLGGPEQVRREHVIAAGCLPKQNWKKKEDRT